MNGIDNTNHKSALTKQFKQWVDGAVTNAMTMTVKQSVENTGNLQKGAGG